MTTPVSHPLVDAYLRDLDRLLHGVDPGERAEVLAGVHEHLEVSLGPDASDDDVRRTLAELGSPQSVADEAYAGRTPTGGTAGPGSASPVGTMSRGWVPTVVGLLLGLALLLVVLVVSAGAGYGTSGTETVGADGQVVRTTEIEFSGAPSALLSGLMLTWPLWLTATLLAGLSPLWSSRQAWTLALLVPVTATILWLLPVLGWILTEAELGINVGAWVGLALGLVGGGLVLTRLVVAGSRRAAALAAGRAT
ncbi:HAAS signaling domain-containing protein [Knoellia sp. CPCC 206435]|uniref:HAAS signaling domain-containing protein n=1 Tax=Knoellia terrae TaxID=3404797 RepID=UPI003B4286A5